MQKDSNASTCSLQIDTQNVWPTSVPWGQHESKWEYIFTFLYSGEAIGARRCPLKLLVIGIPQKLICTLRFSCVQWKCPSGSSWSIGDSLCHPVRGMCDKELISETCKHVCICLHDNRWSDVKVDDLNSPTVGQIPFLVARFSLQLPS